MLTPMPNKHNAKPARRFERIKLIAVHCLICRHEQTGY